MATTTAPPEQAVAPAPKPLKTIQALLKSDQFKEAVAAALPKHLSKERFARVALNAVMRKPELLACTQESFFLCLLDLSMYGLEPDGRRAHLIPFKDNKTKTTICTLIIDYKGIAECVRRSGEVSYIHADIVYENDEFDCQYGSGARLIHKPALDHTGKKAVWAYSFVKLRDGSEDFTIMSIADVNKIRARSRAKDSGPWVSDYDQMAIKTVFRRHSKWLPLSAEVRDVIERDDEITGGLDTDMALEIAQSSEAQGNSLKERLLQQTAGEGPRPVTQEDVDRLLAEKAAKDAAAPEIREYASFEDAPDPFEAPVGMRIKVQGKEFAPNADGSAWREA